MTSAQTVVLDTSVLAELMKPRPDLAVLRWTNAQPIGALAMTAVSLAELTYAMLRMSELARTVDLREALNEFVHDDLANRVLPFDDLAADYFAEFAWRREQAGTPIDAAEAQVAAICRANGVTLATKDPAPYAALGVTAVDPWTAPPPVLVEVPVVVSSPELDRHGKPIPPRRPGAARGGVGPSRPPRRRRRRTTTKDPAKKPKGAKSAPQAPPPSPVQTPPAPHDHNALSAEAVRIAQARLAGSDRMRRHVQATAAAAKPKPRPIPRAKPTAPAASATPEPRGSGPGRRGARLLGPLVDAEGRPVERTADGRLRRRDAVASPAEGAKKPVSATDGGAKSKKPASATGEAATPQKPASATDDGAKPQKAADVDRRPDR